MISPLPVVHLTKQRVHAVVCGYHHTLIASENQVYACGTGDHGQLGLGPTVAASIPTSIEVLKGLEVSGLACSRYHCVAMTSRGMLWSWGRGEYGQLGHGDQQNRDVPMAIESLKEVPVSSAGCGWGHTMITTAKGEVMTWGFGGKGQLGHGDTTRHLVPKLVAGLEGAKKMACGYYHNLVATSDTVYSWGKSDRGQLGHGSTTMALVPTAVEALSGKGIEHLDCGDYNSMVATESGEVYMWGRGQEGQMGNGMGEDVLSPIQHPAFNGNSLITLSLGWGHGAAITKQPLDVARLSHNPKQDSSEEAGDTDDSMQIS